MICTFFWNQEELTFLSLRNALLQNYNSKLGTIFLAHLVYGLYTSPTGKGRLFTMSERNYLAIGGSKLVTQDLKQGALANK